MEQEYISAFQRCYPQKRVEVKRAFNKQGTLIGYRVGIDGDFGSMILSEQEMREATLAFRR